MGPIGVFDLSFGLGRVRFGDWSWLLGVSRQFSAACARVVFRWMREDITCMSCSAQMRFVFSGYCSLALSGMWMNSLYLLGSSFAFAVE